MSVHKKSNFLSIGPVSSGLMCSAAVATIDMPGPPAKGAFSIKDKEVAESKSSYVVDEFFWIGSSIVAFSKWRLGYIGKTSMIDDILFVHISPKSELVIPKSSSLQTYMQRLQVPHCWNKFYYPQHKFKFLMIIKGPVNAHVQLPFPLLHFRNF